MDTATQSAYAGMFHIHALASVCCARVKSVYPQAGLHVRHLYDRWCFPRNEEAGKTIHIQHHSFLSFKENIQDFFYQYIEITGEVVVSIKTKYNWVIYDVTGSQIKI